MKPPTLTDVARHAGVSYATADRVLNNRGQVSSKSTEKVQAAVETLGYVRNVAAANLSQGRTYRFVFVLPEGSNAFFHNIREILRDRSALMQGNEVSIELCLVPAFDAQGLSEQLFDLSQKPPDSIAVVGLDANVLAEPMAMFRAVGTPVVALISDLQADQRVAYIGINNRAAGRTAARLLGLSHGGQAGRVQVLVGDLSARDHHDRLAGFCDLLQERHPGIEILPTLETGDDAVQVEAAVRKVMVENSDISGVYNVGAGNAGLARALTRLSKRPLVAVHELVPRSRAALEEGLFDFVIDQRPHEEIDAALALMRALADGLPRLETPQILPTIYVRDNLPTDMQRGCDPV